MVKDIGKSYVHFFAVTVKEGNLNFCILLWMFVYGGVLVVRGVAEK
jgi:hypothetical protein